LQVELFGSGFGQGATSRGDMVFSEFVERR